MVNGFQIRQGDVCWYNFGEATGSTAAKYRPAIVVQKDSLNDSELRTTILVPLTSQLRYADIGDNVFVSTAVSGLEKDSVALCHLPTVINKADMEYPIGHLPKATIERIVRGVTAVFGA